MNQKKAWKYLNDESNSFALVSATLLTACKEGYATPSISNNVLTIEYLNGITVTIDNFLGREDIFKIDTTKCWKNSKIDCHQAIGYNCDKCEIQE